MSYSNYFALGRISKTFGYKGELTFFLDVDAPENYAKLQSVFVEIKGNLVPYFIEKISIRGQQATVTLQDVSTEQALALVGSDLYLPLSSLPKLKGNQFYFHEVTGFNMRDTKHGDIGVLEHIIDNGPQAIFQIKKDDKEILIPVIDQFIIEVNRPERFILVDAPEGLIEFYLEL